MFIVGLGMDVATFEQKVFEVDGILIRIRASSAAHVQDYSYVRAAPANKQTEEQIDRKADRQTDTHRKKKEKKRQ